MREVTRAEILIAATPDEVLAVIADVESYPTWTAFTKAIVLERDQVGRPVLVEFAFDMGAFKDEQTIRYEWPEQGLVQWELTKSNLLKSLNGSYRVTEVPGGVAAQNIAGSPGEVTVTETKVVYELTIEVAMPLISAMRKRAEKMIVDTALRGLKRKVEGD